MRPKPFEASSSSIRELDPPPLPPPQAGRNRAAAAASDAVIECARLAIEATGGLGFMRSSALERLYRDAHGSLFHPLPRAKQLQFTGRLGLGLAPYA